MMDTIMQDLKQAMKAKDTVALETLRGIKSALMYKKSELARDLEESEELQVLQKEANKRKEAAGEYERGGRAELAEKEKAQLAVVERYLPAAMSEAEIREHAAKAVADTGAAGKKDMGKVMQALMPQLRGRADGKLVNRIVSELLP
jgi:hypothetical protein